MTQSAPPPPAASAPKAKPPARPAPPSGTAVSEKVIIMDSFFQRTRPSCSKDDKH